MAVFTRTTTMNVKFSIVVPCYNEESSLRESITRLHDTFTRECELEIILVDDCSSDRSLTVAETLAREIPAITLLKHGVNQGKGAALRTGFAAATGDIVAIHDADMEYHPRDLKRMLAFMLEHKADVIFGTRFHPREARQVGKFWHTLANKIITMWCNMWTDLNLTDIECCYKMFTREVNSRLVIEEDRFGVEPELVAKCARMKIGGRKLKIFEMGVDYHGRSYDEGKKIGIKDGFRALWAIAKYNMRVPSA